MHANNSGNAGQVEWEESAQMEFQPENAVWGGLGLSEEPPGCCSREGAVLPSHHNGPVKLFLGKIPPDLVSEECQKKAGGGKEPEWVFYPIHSPLGAGEDGKSHLEQAGKQH